MKRFLALFAFAVVLVVPVLAAAQTYNRRYDPGYGQAYNLSADDQRNFDSYYSRWLEYRRTNNREETVSMERRMQEIMARYRIPSNTPYSRVASSGAHGAHNRWGRQAALPRFTPDDESRFRSYYQRWQQYRATNNRAEVISMERRMQEVMSHYNLPPGVTYDDVMQSFGAATGTSGWNNGGRTYGYAFPQFSAEDASRFRSYYGRWQQYRRTNNRSEVASMENRMRDVMAQYNLPSNMSFDDVMNGLNGYPGSGR